MRGKNLGKEKLEKAILMRGQGYSLPEISQTLDVARTTLFNHIKDAVILPKHFASWKAKRGGSKKRKLIKEKIAREEVRKTIGQLTSQDKLIVLSCLYWAEGSKKDFSLSNTDPQLVKLFINCLRDVFNIKNDQFKISTRIYEDINPEESIKFWSRITGVPLENFGVNVLEGKKRGKLKYGMARVRITKGGDYLKRIFATNQIIAKKIAPIA